MFLLITQGCLILTVLVNVQFGLSMPTRKITKCIVQDSLLVTKMNLDRENDVCHLSEAVISDFHFNLFVKPELHDEDLDALNERWDKYQDFALHNLQSQHFDRHTAKRFVASEEVRKQFPMPEFKHMPSLSISEQDWNNFLLDMTDCFGSFYDGMKIITAFDFDQLVVKFRRKDSLIETKGVQAYPGKTFFANTATNKHLHGHFAMKALQFFSLVSSPGYGIPETTVGDFDNFIFQDFPVYPCKEGSWVDEMWSLILQTGTAAERRCFSMHLLTHGTKYKECIQKGKGRLSLEPIPTTETDAKSGYFTDIYFSGNYERPFPFDNSYQAWHQKLLSSNFAARNPSLKIALTRKELKPSDVNILWIDRVDGTATRTVINRDELIVIIRGLFPEATITVLEMKASIPLGEQAAYFANATAVVSSHGSQLWNMIFMRPKSCILEMQAVWYTHEFKSYGQAIGVPYFIQFFGNIARENNGKLHLNYGMYPTLNTGLINADFIARENDVWDSLTDIQTLVRQLVWDNNQTAALIAAAAAAAGSGA